MSDSKQVQNVNRFSKDGIYVFGAKEHNLKNINIFIPRDKITVITGLSGSGKSTLAFDTIYGEGQRRYLESLSTYARYFIDKMKRPEVDVIYGLSPSIAIHQKTINTNPRSTVGTVTDIYDYLRLLYARLGEVFCPEHQIVLKSQTAEEIVADVIKTFKNQSVSILSPIARGKKGEFTKEISQCLTLGFDQGRINGKWMDLGRFHKLPKRKDHYIDILMDRLTIQESQRTRIIQSVQRALSLSDGYLKVEKKSTIKNYSLKFACSRCDYSFFDLDPKLFSFNNPKGSCPSCNGTGLSYFEEFDEQEQEETFYEEVCPDCSGKRLRREVLNVKIKGKSISDLCELPADELYQFIQGLKYKGVQKLIADKVIKKLFFHLDFLKDLSLGYLHLNRSLSTLSGGEAQRIRLVSQLSSPLVGVLYVLDEPSIGLHSKDHSHILNVLEKIRDRGNTIIMVEHDMESICYADKIIDLGPGAGIHGGHLIAEGSLQEIKKNKKSLTGSYLSGRKKIPNHTTAYTGKEQKLVLKNLRENNLKNVNVQIPLGRLIGVSGVSGSGKSTLINSTLYPILFNHLNQGDRYEGECDSIEGLDFVGRVIQINQKPIGRTPRSNPATYIGVFSMIRMLFAHVPESRTRGYSPGYFSFNVSGGRCEHCKGAGSIKLEMRFLPDVFTPCEFCHSKRYSPEILNVTYKGKNIYDVLSMTINQAEEFFKNHKSIHSRLKFLKEVGLGYLTLGQSSTTLSGGEAQRVKLSRELSKRPNNHTVYILDEPTTGLHFQDVERLIHILHQLVKQGHTVIVIEHHLDVLQSCDYLIDLGPEGGRKGGHVVFQGPPQEIVKNKKSYTGHYLKEKSLS